MPCTYYKYTMPRPNKPITPAPRKHYTPLRRSSGKLRWSHSITTTAPRTRSFQMTGCSRNGEPKGLIQMVVRLLAQQGRAVTDAAKPLHPDMNIESAQVMVAVGDEIAIAMWAARGGY